jgi:ligand-binding SRPBCC domain-containing protein
MSIYTFHAEQKLPVTLEQAWDFFSSPFNLSKIIPPEMDFKIKDPGELKKIFSGMRIRYSVKPLMGIPVEWQTLICDVNEPAQFTDKQIKGPYRRWEHTHVFIENEGGVTMVDDIVYQLPLGLLGDAVHALIVRSKIRAIFDFRKKTLDKLFP